MRQYKDEHDVERHLIDMIQERHHPMMAWHNDTTRDGYPDVTVVGTDITLVEVKYDRKKEGSRLLDMMEASQPVLMHDMAQAGWSTTFLLIYHAGWLTLYAVDGILLSSMAGKKAKDGLLALVSSDSMSVIADYVAHRSKT